MFELGERRAKYITCTTTVVLNKLIYPTKENNSVKIDKDV